ncbi:hypothetical protein FE257_005162, partial [Aspergillus nanangensis]
MRAEPGPARGRAAGRGCLPGGLQRAPSACPAGYSGLQVPARRAKRGARRAVKQGK